MVSCGYLIQSHVPSHMFRQNLSWSNTGLPSVVQKHSLFFSHLFFFHMFWNITAQVSSPHCIFAARVVLVYRSAQICAQRGWCRLTAPQWWDETFWKLKTSLKTCMQEFMLCFSYSWCWKVILQLSISQFLIDPCFFPESVTTFQLKMLPSQDQMKSDSFHNLSIFYCLFFG